MKRLIVKACGNSPLEEIRASIEARVPYAQFHESLESFRIISFDIPDENIDQVKGNVNDCGHRCFWDTTIELDPIKEEVIVEDIETEVSLEASQDTTWATSSGGQYRWFRVVQWDGQPVFEYSFDQSTWYKPGISVGGGAGYQFYLKQTDSSNTGYPLRFSTTPDGIWNGGVEYTGSNWNPGNYAPGSSSHTSYYSYQGPPTHPTTYTPPVLYPYCPNQPGMYRYQSSPVRHGSFSYALNAWHLDRVSKKNRSALNNQFTYTKTGNGVDLYIIDSGVRGASRPTGSTAALHPELYDPDNRSSLTGTSEQGDYRVYELSHYSGLGGTNEDDNGHGTNCAILASGYRYGVAKDLRIYALKAFSSTLGATFSDLASAYQAVIDHNNPSSAYYKGNNRPAIINASFGATTPSGSNPIIELNDVGTDYPYNDLEILDEIESTVSRSNNIIICRSAGNGFISASDTFLGPLQAKFKTGARTGGPKDLRFNAEDFDQPKIVVGATEPGDNVADFSNYGDSVDVYAPGQRIVCPDYEWSANTSYGSGSTTYDNISGTSFSTPIVAGIIATWLEHSGYDATTSNLPQKAKDWIRTTNAGHRTDAGRSTNYPVNMMDERELISNPFSTTNASSLLVVKFNPADAGYFIGKIGKKVQIRTPSPIATIVGNINLTEALRQWWGITAEDAVANSITVDLGSGNVFTSTNTDVGGGGPFSMGIVTDTHQETDGPHFGSVSLTTRTDAQEANSTGTGVGTGLPVDAGYFDSTTGTFTSSVNNGAIFPFVEKTFTWDQAQGTISQSPIAHGSVVNINLGYSSAVTSGGETVDVGPWTISGDSLIGTNLIFNTSTGYLQSSASSSYFQDTSFNVTVTDTSTGNAQTYNFILTASGVNNIRSHTGGSPAVPGNFRFTNQCSSELDKYWKVNPAIDGNWTLAFQPGNAHLNDPSMQNGTKAYGNHTFAYTSIQMRDQAVNKKAIGFPPVPHQWTDQTPPPTLNYTITMGSAQMRDQTINKKAIGFPPVPHIWTQGPLPGSLNYTLTYLNPTVYISPGRPFALLNNGQIFPRFFDEVDEVAVPANTASGAFAEIDHYDFLNSTAITDACYLNSSREFLKDKRPRTGLLYPRGNTYRPPEN